MKNYNNKKSIMERGGLMIEALAMLGLIAVVTPTMYKKSAERTMEVEDINTATTMRTFMNAVEAYMNTNYITIMKDTEAHLQTVGDDAEKMAIKDVNVDELEPYLPYKYTETGGLFNYTNPKIRIVRSGDNLTAFALFPAKVGGEDGVGQERTVRIASLIGANGGYVPTGDNDGNKSARGVGGVWNLDNTHYKAVFGDDDAAKQFSLVTSSSNVVNSSTAAAEADNTKYLQRTKENDNELWRNAMRTDLYMGGANPDRDPDKQNEQDFFSIYNVNEMIIGAETDSDQKLKVAIKDGDEGKSLANGSYGLYVAGSGTRGNGPGNVYIKDTLMAAGNRFWASNEALKYTGTNLEFDGTNFRIGKNQTTDAKDADNYVISGYAEKGNSQLAIMGKVDGSGNMTGVVDIAEAGDIGNYAPSSTAQKKANVVINTKNKGTGGATVNPPKYSADDKAPEFGVDVSGNMVVEGVLAAGQLDVNNIRTANISVGSENIDDEFKWMDVNKDGVHVHQPAGGAYKGTQIEARDQLITMRVGANNAITSNTDSASIESDNDAQIIMDATNGITEKVAANKKINLASGNIGVNISDAGGNGLKVINIGKTDDNGAAANGATNDPEYQVNFSHNADVNMYKSNLKVSDGNNPVFTVRGKGKNIGIGDSTTDNAGNTAALYDIAGHGETVFTDKGDGARYLAMTVDPQDDVAVNIVRGQQSNNASDNAKGIMYIDMDDRSATAHAKVVETSSPSSDQVSKGISAKITRTDQDAMPGSIYIRKGLIDLVPNTSQVKRGFAAATDYEVNDTDVASTADTGMGVIRASRFVANNVDYKGRPITVPDFFNKVENGKTIYEQYNGKYKNTQGQQVVRNRYDTYMVNPAYTSVMNDIKLVSRGGARLSDILPVFVTKGIYTAVNNYSEQRFGLDGGANDLTSRTLYLDDETSSKPALLHQDLCKDKTADACRSAGLNFANEPASPIIGVVPAPQCPPGYARMITVTPASIRMAEAGRFKDPATKFNEGFFDIDVDNFTSPTNSEYYKNESTGQVFPFDDMKTKQEWIDWANANGVPLNEIDKMGQAVQLYSAYINANKAAKNMNPSYQANINIVGSNEKWSSSNPEGFDGKIEIDVANKDYMLTDNEGLNANSTNESISQNIGGRTVTSFEENRFSTGGTLPGTVKHSIKEKNTSTSNAYNAVNSLDTAQIQSGQKHYVKTANVISNDANSQILTIIDDTGEENNRYQPRSYKLQQDIDISGTRILADRIQNVGFETPRYYKNGVPQEGTPAYILTSSDPNAFEPITIQKSTWLKTAAIPLKKGGKFTGNYNEYASGWAILMGFLYPQHGYRNILNALKVNTESAASRYKTYPMYDTTDKGTRHAGGFDEKSVKPRDFSSSPSEKDEYFFWNVFPVEQESLEAFITTYCYFDQDNAAFNMFNSSDDVKAHLPMIDYITTFPGGYEPEGENKKYRERLNDPSMKYNELW